MAVLPTIEPDDRQKLQAYLSWLCRKYKTVDYVGALSGDHVRLLQLSVPAVFVQQRVRADPPPVSLPRELYLRFLAHGRAMEHDVSPDLNRELLNRDLREYSSRRTRPVLEVLAEVPRVVLLGSPGAGKSTLARYLTLALADPAAEEVPTAIASLAEGEYVPFIAELRAYPDYADRRSFLDVIDDIAGQECPVSVRSVLEGRLRGWGNALVIFDGLDEVFEPGLRNRLKSQIREFANLYAGLRVVVTSRVGDYDRHEFDKGGFAHFTLDDLKPDEVAEFADRFCGALYEHDRAEARRVTARLLDAVQVDQAPAIAELAGNPLLLTMLAFLARSGSIPPSRVEVLRRMAELLTEKWDADRDLKLPLDSERLERIPKSEKLELLRPVARKIIMSAGWQEPKNYMPRQEFIRIFSKFFRKRYDYSAGRADSVAGQLLNQLDRRDYILAKFETDAYGFVHRTFLDYLAAYDVCRKFSSQDLKPRDILVMFRDRWRQPAWRGVLPLLAGLMDARHVEPAILAMLQSDPLWYLSPDPLPRHILLAVQCLGEIRHLGEFRDGSKAIAAALVLVLEKACEPTGYGLGLLVAPALQRDVLPVLTGLPADWVGRALYENWYLARGQFLVGEQLGEAQAVAARIYVALLGHDGSVRDRLCAWTAWADSAAVRMASAEALAANWPDDAATASLLCAIAGDDHQNWYVRQRVLHVMAIRRRGAAEIYDLLRDRVQADDVPEVRITAVQALATGWRLGEVATLLRDIGSGVTETEPAVRAAAVRAVAEGWPDTSETEPWLRDRIVLSEIDQVRVAAVQVLVLHWREAPWLLTWLRKHAHQADEPHALVRAAAVRALASSWPEQADTHEILMLKAPADGDDVWLVRRAAVEALAANWRDERTARMLRDLATEDPDVEIRYVATQALATYWSEDGDAARVLEDLALGEPGQDPYVVAAAATALATIRSGDQEVARQLSRLAVEDDRWYVRRAVLRAVAANWRNEPAIADWLKKRAASDREAEVRDAAAQALADGWHRSSTLDWLRAAGSGSTVHLAGSRRSTEVRRVAVQAVAAGWPEESGTYSWLCERATDESHPEAQRVAIGLLATQDGWRSAATAGLLRQVAVSARSREARRAAIRTLAVIRSGDPETGDWLRERAFPGNKSAVQLAVISAVAAGWHGQPQTVCWLRDHAAADSDPRVSRAAARILSQGWPGARKQPG